MATNSAALQPKTEGNRFQHIFNIKHSSKNGCNGETFTVCGFWLDGCEPYVKKFDKFELARQHAIEIEGVTHFRVIVVKSETTHTVVYENAKDYLAGPCHLDQETGEPLQWRSGMLN